MAVKTFANSPRLLHRLEKDPGYSKSPHYNTPTYFDHVWDLYVKSPLSFYSDVLQEVSPQAQGLDEIELKVVETAVPISVLYPEDTPERMPSNGKRKLRLYFKQLLHNRQVSRATVAHWGLQWHEGLMYLLREHLGTFPSVVQVYVRRKWSESPYGLR